jgi:hypothetical protein
MSRLFYSLGDRNNSKAYASPFCFALDEKNFEMIGVNCFAICALIIALLCKVLDLPLDLKKLFLYLK